MMLILIKVVAMVHKYRIPCLLYSGERDIYTNSINQEFMEEQKKKKVNTWRMEVYKENSSEPYQVIRSGNYRTQC
jgi:hypothetical protein